MSDENQLDQSRRRLCSLIESTYVRMKFAASLLEHRAGISPTSAEAKAHQVLNEANAEIERWIMHSADLVGLKVTTAELSAEYQPRDRASAPTAVEASEAQSHGSHG
jgi:hypothetical protein